MNSQHSSRLKWAAIILLVAGATWFVARRSTAFWHTGEPNALVWFYDESEKRLYPAPVDIPPPDTGIGGKKDDGVRAVVVGFGREQADPQKRRIAYLETYAPELKALLERVRASRAAGQPFTGRIPARDSDYFQSNTLVRSPEEDTWHPIGSAGGQKVMTAWRSWRGPDGQPPVVCVP